MFVLSFVVEITYATYTTFISRGYRLAAAVSSAAVDLLKMLLVYRVVLPIGTLPALVVGQASQHF